MRPCLGFSPLPCHAPLSPTACVLLLMDWFWIFSHLIWVNLIFQRFSHDFLVAFLWAISGCFLIRKEVLFIYFWVCVSSSSSSRFIAPLNWHHPPGQVSRHSAPPSHCRRPSAAKSFARVEWQLRWPQISANCPTPYPTYRPLSVASCHRLCDTTRDKANWEFNVASSSSSTRWDALFSRLSRGCDSLAKSC